MQQLLYPFTQRREHKVTTINKGHVWNHYRTSLLDEVMVVDVIIRLCIT